MSAIEQPAEQQAKAPISERTLAIMQAIERLDSKLSEMQDVTQAVQEIRNALGLDKTWRGAILRALKHFVSLVDPPKK